MSSKTLIGVIGSKQCDEKTYALARDVGKRLAEKGFGVICGGMGGVMEAACKGVSEAGGLAVGILPGDTPESANPYVGISVATGMGIARNVIIVKSAAAVIAITGGAGTLSEIAHCLQLGVPVIGLNSLDVSEQIIRAATAEEAVDEATKRV
jgi:uncharacterized protein (TIGR00725 family)